MADRTVALRREQGQPRKAVSAYLVKESLEQALALINDFQKRFIIPEDFLPEHADREKMCNFLRGKAFRGTDSGGAMQAGVSLRMVAEWRKLPEFVEMEELADRCCTDRIEEMRLMQAMVTGDKDAIDKALKGRRREVYGDKQEVTGKGGGPVEFRIEIGGVPRPKRLDDA